MGRLICAALLAAAACGKAGGAEDAWRRAGLEVGEMTATEGAAFGGGTCRRGEIDGVVTTLCDYPDEAAAKRAESAGLAQVAGTTGLAIAEGRTLLVVADPASRDPHGKTINRIAKAFKDR